MNPDRMPWCNTGCEPLLHSLFTSLGGDDSDEEEEVDSNNEGGSLHSERTDKDEDACEGKLHVPHTRPSGADSS